MSWRQVLLAAVAAFWALCLPARVEAWYQASTFLPAELDAIERAVQGEGIVQKFPPAPAPQ